jgi:hypothetical protein
MTRKITLLLGAAVLTVAAVAAISADKFAVTKARAEVAAAPAAVHCFIGQTSPGNQAARGWMCTSDSHGMTATN